MGDTNITFGRLPNIDRVYIFADPSEITPTYGDGSHLVDFYGKPVDMWEPYPVYKQHADGHYYKRGVLEEGLTRINFEELHQFGRFVGEGFGMGIVGKHISHSYYLLNSMKEQVLQYVFVQQVDSPDDEFCVSSVAGMMHYAWYAGIPLAKCVARKCNKSTLFLVGKDESLGDVWNRVQDQVSSEPEGGKRQIVRLLTLSGMNKREFADYFGIKHRTVENWIYMKNSDAPDWTVPLMELKLETDGKI